MLVDALVVKVGEDSGRPTSLGAQRFDAEDRSEKDDLLRGHATSVGRLLRERCREFGPNNIVGLRCKKESAS